MNIDIDFRSKNTPAKKLSNLYPHQFTFQGVQCGSMEGFLQSLKRKDIPIQLATCAKAGFDAKFASKNIIWQDTGLWWRGTELDRFSDNYIFLIYDAYRSLYDQNNGFKEALLSTYPHSLDHSIGRTAQKDTILTKREFCSILESLRQDGILLTFPVER